MDIIERSEDFCFDLTRSELVELDRTMNGGLSAHLKTVIDSHDDRLIMDTYNKLSKAHCPKNS